MKDNTSEILARLRDRADSQAVTHAAGDSLSAQAASLIETQQIRIDALLKAAPFAFATIMSEISERCYAAGWMQGVEDDLLKLIQGSGLNYGGYEIDILERESLENLLKATGAWFDGEKLVPIDEWRFGGPE